MTNKYDEWLIGYILDIQEGNTQNPICTTPELDARAAMAKQFHIKETWAYEVIRVIVKMHPELHLAKVDVLNADGSYDHTEQELIWIEPQ